MTTNEGRCEPPPELRAVDGWHWVQCIRGPNPDSYEPELVYWYSVERRAFCGASGWDDGDIGEGYRYLAPVTPPATVAALVEALEECANDLEAYVMRQYSGDVLTPGNALRRARDLAPVDAARAALAAYREAAR